MTRPQHHLSLPVATLFCILTTSCGAPNHSGNIDSIKPIIQLVDTPPKRPLPDGVDVALECEPFVLQHEKDHPSLDLLKRDWCGIQEANGDIIIPMEVMSKTGRFSYPPSHPGNSYPSNLACNIIALSNGEVKHAYVREDGRARIAQFPHDHYCDIYRNGVFISYTHGKVGFYDGDLNLVRQTNYTLAEAFYKHLSKVCTEKPKRKYHGEHFNLVGGKCGYIGEDYEVVLPIVHAYESAQRPTGGKYDEPNLE